MVHTLLAAKLTPPPARPHLVARPRLHQLLREALTRPLTLVCAPAGFGKTTLLTQMQNAECRMQNANENENAAPLTQMQNAECGMQNEHVPHSNVAWLALDEHDDEPLLFLAYLAAALDTLWPNVSAAARVLLQAPEPPTPHAVITQLLNSTGRAVGQARTAMPGLLVLDDYHAISAPPIHAALAYFIEHVPVQLRVVITSRAEPPLPLARWRARGLVAELRTEQLRFSSDESRCFLQQVMGLDLAPAALAALGERTEGWVAGLQLAALAMQTSAGELAAQAALPAGHPYVADYLLNEVVAHQPPEIQRFLLRTSVLERLHPDLCDALVGQTADRRPQTADDGLQPIDVEQSAAATLEYLARANLFVVALDAGKQWYRYHPLLREALRQRLLRNEPALLAVQHRCAAHWYEAQGMGEAALQHALEAGDTTEAARMLASVAHDLVQREEMPTLRRWLALLPAEAIAAEPRLCLARAWMLLDANRPQPAARALQQAAATIDGVDTHALRAELLALKALAAAMEARSAEALEYAHACQQHHAPDDPFARTLVAYSLGAAYKMGSDGVRAEHWLRAAAATAPGDYLAAAALANLGDLLHDLARLPEAERVLRQGLERARVAAGIERHSAGWMHWDLGRIAYECNDLPQASHEAERAVGLAANGEYQALWARGLLLQAQVAQARNELKLANELLDAAERAAYRSDDVRLARLVLRRRVLLALADRNLPTARLWADALASQPPSALAPAGDMLTLARLELAEGRPARAIEHLRIATQRLEATNLVIGRVQALALEALARRALGQPEQALVPLEQALYLAARGAIVRIFCDEGAPMHELLRRIARTTAASPDYLARLLAAFEPASAATSALLTPREREILRMLAAGLSNREIAAQLVVAEATLKRHVSNLYLKLAAHSRTQALARAAELRLL